jgi:hypothetical protein
VSGRGGKADNGRRTSRDIVTSGTCPPSAARYWNVKRRRCPRPSLFPPGSQANGALSFWQVLRSVWVSRLGNRGGGLGKGEGPWIGRPWRGTACPM